MSEPLHTYRVTFAHVRHRTQFVVEVDAATPTEAQEIGGRILYRQLGERAGAVLDWRWSETVEVPT